MAVEDSTPKQVLGPFGTLNNADDALVLPDNMAQDLLNVETTDGGKSVRKRKGLGLAFTLPISTSATHGIYSFYDGSGNDVSLFFNDRYLTGSVNGAAITTIFSTGTVDATWQCTDSLGFAYCASTARDILVKTNGVTYSQIASVSNGTMVTATTERIAMAGFSGAPSQINLSGANDFTNWTLGGEATSPYNETINAPGSRITHITYACNGLMWFKETSFGITLNPDDALAAQNVILAPEIGTLDNTSVIYPGGLQFRAQDGHIYNYDCAGIEKLTRDITPTINTSGSRTSNSWTQTSQSDFGSGSFVRTSSTSSNGDIVVTRFTDAFSSLSNWTTSYAGSSPSGWSVSGGTATFDGSSGGEGVLLSSPVINSSVSSFYVYGNVAFGNNFTTSHNCVGVCGNFGSGCYAGCLASSGGGSPQILKAEFWSGASTATFNNVIISSTIGTKDTAFHTIGILQSATGYMQLYIDGVYRSSATDTTYSNLTKPFVVLAGDVSPKISDYAISPSSGIYYSAVHNAPGITSWDTFSSNYQNNDGTHSFFVRSSTDSFGIASSTPTWIAQTPGGVVSASTGTYFQVRDDFSITAATQNPTLNDFTFNWFEGVAADKSYGIYFGKDNALWWSVPVGAGQSTNNRILRWDLINRGWVLYDIPANGFLIRNQNLYVGSSSAGKIWKFGDTDSDEGAAIDSYWKSKDFSFDPTVEKEFTTLSVVAKSVAASSMTVTYTIDGSSSTAYTVNLYNPSSTVLRNNRYLPAGRAGNTFNVEFGNNAADQYWELFTGVFGYKKRPWQVGN